MLSACGTWGVVGGLGGAGLDVGIMRVRPAKAIMAKTNPVGQGLPKEEKEAKRLEACQKGGVTYEILAKVEKFINDNGSDGHSVGKSLTIADLQVYSMTGSLVSGLYDGVPTNLLEQFSGIQGVRKAVRSIPAVVKFYDELKYDISPPFQAFN